MRLELGWAEGIVVSEVWLADWPLSKEEKCRTVWRLVD